MQLCSPFPLIRDSHSFDLVQFLREVSRNTSFASSNFFHCDPRLAIQSQSLLTKVQLYANRPSLLSPFLLSPPLLSHLRIPSNSSMTTPTRRLKASFTTLFALVALVLLSALPRAEASALTTTINANERTCFYALVDKVGEKVSIYGFMSGLRTVTNTSQRSQVGFYFAVRRSTLFPSLRNISEC